jgi:hypothetical protein
MVLVDVIVHCKQISVVKHNIELESVDKHCPVEHGFIFEKLVKGVSHFGLSVYRTLIYIYVCGVQ